MAVILNYSWLRLLTSRHLFNATDLTAFSPTNYSASYDVHEDSAKICQLVQEGKIIKLSDGIWKTAKRTAYGASGEEMTERQDVVTGVYSRSNIESASATDGINKPGSSEMNSDITNGNVFKNADSFRLHSLENSTRKNTTVHTLIPEEPLEIQCGEKSALLFVSKLCQGSKGPCILYGSEWLTPNELQYICGRETAKDWKRSIRHKGKSLKSLIAQGFLKVHPPICDCPGCRVSSPVVSFNF